jgi:hypothetical protein
MKEFNHAFVNLIVDYAGTFCSDFGSDNRWQGATRFVHLPQMELP